MHLNFAFKPAFHFSTLAIKLLTALQSCFKLQLLAQHNEQSSFKCLATRTTHLLLNLKRSILLVMYSAYNAFCYYING